MYYNFPGGDGQYQYYLHTLIYMEQLWNVICIVAYFLATLAFIHVNSSTACDAFLVCQFNRLELLRI